MFWIFHKRCPTAAHICKLHGKLIHTTGPLTVLLTNSYSHYSPFISYSFATLQSESQLVCKQCTLCYYY